MKSMLHAATHPLGTHGCMKAGISLRKNLDQASVKPNILKPRIQNKLILWNSSATYISLRNSPFRSSTLVSFGLPGQHASAKADSAKKSRSSSFNASNLDGIPTSSDN